MDYVELNVRVTDPELAEILTAELAELPYESFQTEGEVLKAYMASFDPGFLGLYAASPEALAALEAAVQEDGNVAEAWSQLGHLGRETQKPAEAARCYQKAARSTRRITDRVRRLWLKHFNHHTDNVPWCAELSICTCRGNFRQ